MCTPCTLDLSFLNSSYKIQTRSVISTRVCSVLNRDNCGQTRKSRILDCLLAIFRSLLNSFWTNYTNTSLRVLLFLENRIETETRVLQSTGEFPCHVTDLRRAITARKASGKLCGFCGNRKLLASRAIFTCCQFERSRSER